ncbi:MAG: NADH-quinone oxidoreductase subunit N [Actinomycetota bacterium]
MPLDLPPVELGAIGPEIALAATALLLIVGNAFLPPERKTGWHLPAIATGGLVVAVVLAQRAWSDLSDEGPTLQLAGMVANDGFSIFVKVGLAVFGLLTVWLGREYLKSESLENSEFYALVLFAVAGMMLMASSTDLIVTFIALETFSIALYVLVGFRTRSLVSQESAMKYFLLGAFSSAFFLLGIALVYGITGSTNLHGSGGAGAEQGIVEFLTTTPPTDVGLLVLAVGFLIIGLGFKVAAVPFHMWTPDAYQGAPSPVTGFMAAGTKMAAFAALLRLLDVTLFQLRDDWRPLVLVVATLTMVVGSLFAVVQEDVKRILAYSSIAHAGFVFTAVVATNDRAVSGALFYLVTYGLTVMGAFAVVAIVGGRDERRIRLTDYRGLFYQRPVLAGALSLFLLSLAGVPLTSGFVAKLVVFGPAIDAGYSWLVVVGAITSAIAAFFYLRIMVVMYMQEPDAAAAPIAIGPLSGAVVGITAVATLVFFFAWGPLFDLAERATIFFS